MITHKSSFLFVVQTYGKNPFSSYSNLPSPWRYTLACPELYFHILSGRNPWACGTSSHKNHLKVPGAGLASSNGLWGWWGSARGGKVPGVCRPGSQSCIRTWVHWLFSSLYRNTVLSSRALNPDACQRSQSYTSGVPSQPSDSSQACQVALNKHKLVARRKMQTKDVDANGREQQSFTQNRKTVQQTTHGLADENNIIM